MYTRYSYAGEASTNPRMSTASLGSDSMFPGTFNPGLQENAGVLGSSELFDAGTIHGEVEPAVMGEPGTQPNFVPVVWNFCAKVDLDANPLNPDQEFFMPKGTIITVQAAADPPTFNRLGFRRAFNAPGTKPKHENFQAHGMISSRANADGVFHRLGVAMPRNNALVQVPLAEGTLIRPDKESYLAVAVADTATIHVPTARYAEDDDPMVNAVELARAGALPNGLATAKVITVRNQVGSFAAGSLVYVSKPTFAYAQKVWVDVILSDAVLEDDACFRYIGELRTAFTADGQESELLVALSPVLPHYVDNL